MSNTLASRQDLSLLSSKQTAVLLISILIVALCGITYQLIIGTVSSYLLGNSVYQFSFTIGFFMFAMGIGSWLSKFMGEKLLRNFILVEVAIALIGGISSIALFMTFPEARIFYEMVMYGLILCIGALVGMEIPILTTILSKRSDTKDSIANVMSLDYIGALIGSVGFPLLLLPTLGLVQSSFAIGLINIFTAIVNIIIFKKQLADAFNWLLWLSLAIFIALTGFIVYGTQITSFAEKHLYFDQVIYSKQTPYQKITVTRSNVNREQRLYIDSHIQFSSKDEHRYHESLVHPVMSIEGPRENVLILGGGDGLAAREVLKYQDVGLIHLVDIDPEMTKISKELPMLAQLNQGSLESEKLTVYNEDAFNFINQPGIEYHRVIIDMPDPHNEAINKLYSKEFYTMIKRRMADGAIAVTQSSSPFFTRQTFWCIEHTLNHVFNETLSYHTSLPSFGIWGFNMARKNQAIPKEILVTVPTKSITSDTIAASQVFSKDMAKVETPINTIMEPKLYQLYIEDSSR